MHITFVVLILLDQITKVIFDSRDFLIFGIHFHPVKNYALPFGLDFGTLPNFFLLFLVYIIAGWFILLLKGKGIWHTLGKNLFLAGAASNLADRLIYGYVRDFIDFKLGFVFNLADVFIILGLGFILLAPPIKPSPVDNLPPTIGT